jgi:hypothetical protein
MLLCCTAIQLIYFFSNKMSYAAFVGVCLRFVIAFFKSFKLNFMRLIRTTKLAFLAMLLPVFCLFSCGNDDTTPTKTITEIVNEGANYTTFKAALSKSGLASTLQGSGSFTLFLPTDAAFAAVGINPSFIGGINEQKAKELVNYHILNKKMAAADIQTADNIALKMAIDTAYLTKNAAGIFINGGKITQADVASSIKAFMAI